MDRNLPEQRATFELDHGEVEAEVHGGQLHLRTTHGVLVVLPVVANKVAVDIALDYSLNLGGRME